MLALKQITKEYPAGGGTVHALKGIDLQFRDSEFVSILGPSGCGKTTTLNIIGGLDRYTSGDLIINGTSTKDYKARDWDAYRNHSVGFVFQTYNLIPHQSVLQNVELALSLSGVSKAERRRRAKEALEKVGLSDQLKKKPGQMSGGQMQRVAIARAIVNDPDIILADEPTGALDTETSVQVMEILKEISKDRLVIMVTHNPDLAETYSTRIIRMLDGVIQSDSMPLTAEELQSAQKAPAPKAKKEKKAKKPSMSFATSFGLSLKNLFTKRGRTVLTSFAGSIGIIGIALIYAVSQGMTTYINLVQEETLSSYPLTLQATHVDMGSLMTSFLGSAQSGQDHELDAVYQKGMIYEMLNALNSMDVAENDLEAFKAYLEERRADPEDPMHSAISGVQYTYNLDLQIYTKNLDGTIIQSDTSALMQDLLLKNFGMDITNMMDLASTNMSSMGTMSTATNLWQEMLPGDDGKLISPVLEKQYDLVYGSWPNSYNEVVLVLDKNNELADLSLFALGLRSQEDIDKLVDAALNKTEITTDFPSWSYQEICDLEYRTVLPASCYHLDELTGQYTDLRDTEAGMEYLYENAEVLRVTGIIRPKEDVTSPMLTGSIAYTSKLTEYVVEESAKSAALQAQKANPGTDIFTGLPFRDTDGDLTVSYKAQAFRDHIAGLDESEKAMAYTTILCIPPQAYLDAALSQTLGAMDRDQMQAQLITILSAQMGMGEKELSEYLSAMEDADITEMFSKIVIEQIKMQYAAQQMQQLAMMPTADKAAAMDAALAGYTEEQCADYYDQVLEFSDATLEENLLALGDVDLDVPASINLYATTFEDKDLIKDAITDYNDQVDEFKQIAYTDYVGLLMSSVTTIINAITYVLISFVAVSLIVSSIMIGVITLISVQERTKEIGILRAIGASKKNVSSMFNAETVIIGFTSGALGVGITYLLCIPINAILHALTGIGNLSAYLPVGVAIALIIISMLLTLISGIIPSRSAAKKDPVVALRTE